jgi:hypothetical protein
MTLATSGDVRRNRRREEERRARVLGPHSPRSGAYDLVDRFVGSMRYCSDRQTGGQSWRRAARKWIANCKPIDCLAVSHNSGRRRYCSSWEQPSSDPWPSAQLKCAQRIFILEHIDTCRVHHLPTLSLVNAFQAPAPSKNPPLAHQPKWDTVLLAFSIP